MSQLVTTRGLTQLNHGARASLWWTAAGFLPFYALVCCLLLLGAAGMNLLNLGLTLPRHELIVGLNKKDVSLFRVLEQGSAPAFSDQDLQTMRDQPGVSDVIAISYGSQPTEALVAFFGQNFETEMVLQSFDPDWLVPEFSAEFSAWKPGDLVPIVVNSSVLAIYNHAYAKSNGLPELSETALKAPFINLKYGPKGREVSLKGHVIGLSPKVALGLAIPRQVLVNLHQQLAIDAPPITEVVLRLEAGEDLRRAQETVTRLGFVINEPGQLLQIIAKSKQLAVGAFGPLFLLLCLLSAFFYCQGYAAVLLVCRPAYVRQLASGTPRGSLNLALLREGALLATLFLLGGSLFGWLLATYANTHYFSPFLSTLLSKQAGAQLSLLNLLWLYLAMIVTSVVLLVPRVLAATRAPKELAL